MNLADIELALTGNFISNDIKKYINTHHKAYYKHNTKNVKLTIDDLGTCDIKNLAKEIVKACDFFQRKLTNITPVKIYFFPSPNKKTLDFGKNSIDIKELNGACTFNYPTTHFVAIYRLEEWQKVLFHELVHFYGLDSTIPPYINRTFSDKYNLKIPVRMTEVYAEVIGMLMNLEYVGNFKNDFEIENAFMTIQYQKVLDFFQISTKKNDDLRLLKSNSNLVTYFIFKLAFLETLEDPRNYLKEQIKNGLLLNNPQEFLDSINKGMNILKSLPKVNIPHELVDTMRMTIVSK